MNTQSSPIPFAEWTRDFQAPPRKSFPWTWYHLMGGSITLEGIRADMKAIQEAGFQGIHVFTTKVVPALQDRCEREVRCLSEPWREAIAEIARECEHRGLQVVFENCPGWSMAGGPWVPAEQAMRRLTWTRTRVQGRGRPGEILLKDLPPAPDELPKHQGDPMTPEEVDARTIAVLALPVSEEEVPPGPPSVVDSDGDRKGLALLLNGFLDSGTPECSFFTLAWDRDVLIRSITVHPASHDWSMEKPPLAFTLESRDAQGQWQMLLDFRYPRTAWHTGFFRTPVTLSLGSCRLQTLRLRFANRGVHRLGGLRFDSRARPNEWEVLAGAGFRERISSPTWTDNRDGALHLTDIVDLTEGLSPDGHLNHTLPEGSWEILHIGHVNAGFKNHPAVPEATGWEADKCNAAAVRHHFHSFVGMLTAADGPAPAGCPTTGVLIDSYECGYMTWTPQMLSEFEKRRGYSARPYLPVLTGCLIHSDAFSRRFLRDFSATIAELISGNFYGEMRRCANEAGLRLFAEEAMGDVVAGDPMGYYATVDEPMSEFWYRGESDANNNKPLLNAVSGARLYGKPRVSAEAWTQWDVRWDEHPFLLKARGDFAFAKGINQMVLHTFPHNPLTDAPPPGPLFCGHIGGAFGRGQTWWKCCRPWVDYLARCQHLLQWGTPCSDLLHFVGEDLAWFEMDPLPGLPKGYAHDLLNAEVLCERLYMQEGRIRVRGTDLSYRVIVLRDGTTISTPCLLALEQLVQGGAVVVGARPQGLPGLSEGPEPSAEWRRTVGKLWGETASGQGRQVWGQGSVHWGRPLGEVLAETVPCPDVETPEEFVLHWIHRRDQQRDVYFLANPQPQPIEVTVGFRSTGRQPWWMDAVTGEVRSLPCCHDDGRQTRVRLRLEDSGSGFVCFEPRQETFRPWSRLVWNGEAIEELQGPCGPTSPEMQARAMAQTAGKYNPGRSELAHVSASKPVTPDGSGGWIAWATGTLEGVAADGGERVRLGSATVPDPLRIEAPWQVHFEGGDAAVTLERLCLWNESEDPFLRHFSGTATYQTVFTLSQEQRMADEIRLDLGRVGWIAEVRINGESVGQPLWMPPFHVRIPRRILTVSSVLEIRVTNPWRNRLLLDRDLPEEQRSTWTTLYPKGNDLVPSGLLGPVRIVFGEGLA